MSLIRMDSNSMSDKEGSVAGMEYEVTMSNNKEVCLEAGGEDMPTCEEFPVEFVRAGTGLKMGSNSGSVAQTERKVAMSAEEDQGADLGCKATREESYDDGVAQLVKARQEALKQKQMGRRAGWQEEVRAELEKRAEAKLQMETTPRNQITSWKDKQTFSKISVNARKTFRSERTQFLFNEVFPILYEQREGVVNEKFSSRLVSKNWKDVIDSSLSASSPLHHTGLFSFASNPAEVNVRDVDSSFRLWTLKELKKFNQKCEQEYRGANPFPFRQLCIGHPLTHLEGFGSLGSAYWTEMGKLIERWGKEIWTAMYIFEDGSIEMKYELLVKYLNLMPNLRELAVSERNRGGNLQEDMLRRLGKDVLGPLKLRMERKPLPELPHLHSLNLQEFTPAPLITAVLEKYGDTLQWFSLENPLNKCSGEYVDLGQFVAGRRLPFRNYSCIYNNSSKITHWNLQLPSLNELRLEYFNVKEGPEVANIFKTVNNCGSTIRRLQLRVNFNIGTPKWEPDWCDLLPSGMKLELPHLEWLNLTIELSEITNVDFLLPLVSLKELIFSHLTFGRDASTRADGNGIIQFAGFRDQLYHSNIWNLLPEIKLVAIQSVPIVAPSKKRGSRLEDLTRYDIEETNLQITVHTRDCYRQHHSDQKGIQLLTEKLTAFTAN